MSPTPLSREQAVERLLVLEPLVVASTSPTGRELDDEGRELDARQTVPWTWALGPFGSWPCTVEEAHAIIQREDGWVLGHSFRVGPAVSWKQGWGFAATRPPPTTEGAR